MTDDRELLFGLLAVQLGFVDAARVSAAAAQGPGLAERLLTSGALSVEQRGHIERALAEVAIGHPPPVEPVGATVVRERFSDSLDEPAGEVVSEHAGRYVLKSKVAAGAKTSTSKDDAEIGRGGIGRVLVVRDQHLGRDVAVKELLAEPGAPLATPDLPASRSTGRAARFLREARVMAQLEHPAIVPVYELGQRVDGTLYYTMKLVRGRTLAAALASCSTLKDRLTLLGHYQDLCQAMAFAHARGVVHRDLKPDNVMVGEFGETQVLDWGLAKVRGKKDLRESELGRDAAALAQASSGQTVAGSIMGTPSYMSPEQASGNVEEVNESSDVWGLGCILYELLTGEPPFSGDTPFEVLGKVLRAPIVPVQRLAHDAPPELAAIAMRALARDREVRYPRAVELAEDLEAFLTGGRVEAHRYSAMQLIARGLRGRSSVWVAAGLSLLSLLAAGGVGLALVDQRDRTRAAQEEARGSASDAFEVRAQLAEHESDLAGAALWAAASLEKAERPDARGLALKLASAWRPRPLFRTRLLTECTKVVLSPGGDTLACPTMFAVLLLDPATGRERGKLSVGPVGWVHAVAFSPDGRSLAAAGDDRAVHLFELSTGKEKSRFAGHEDSVWTLAFSADGKQLASGGRDGAVRLWDLAAGTSEVLGRHPGGVAAVAFSREGLLASGGRDRAVRLWDLATRHELLTLALHEGEVTALAFSPDGTRLATGSADRSVRLWATPTGRELSRLAGHDEGVTSLAFLPDGLRLLSGGSDATARLWDTETGALLFRFAGGESAVRGVAVSTDGKEAVLAFRDRVVQAFSLEGAQGLLRLTGYPDALKAVAVSDDGEWVAAGCADGAVRVRKRDDGADVALLEGHQGPVRQVAFLGGKAGLVSAGDDGLVRVWDLADSRQGPPLEKGARPVRALAVSGDGKRLAWADDQGSLVLYDVAAAAELARLRLDSPAASLAYSADGALLVVGRQDKLIALHDGATGKAKVLWEGHNDAVVALAFSPDGKWVASGSGDRTARLWNVEKGQERVQLLGHTERVGAVAFSADGATLATGSDDNTVRLWDVGSSGELARLTAHDGDVTALAFLPSGEALVSGGQDRAARVLDLSALREDRAALLPRLERELHVDVTGPKLVARDFAGP